MPNGELTESAGIKYLKKYPPSLLILYTPITLFLKNCPTEYNEIVENSFENVKKGFFEFADSE